MSRLKHTSSGFTLVELIITMLVALLVAGAFYTFFKNNLQLYFNLQGDASNFTAIAAESQRISSVVRGLTGIISASDNDLQLYAYFFPQDTYESQVHYYLNASATQLLVDVTQMTANPPTGVPIPSTTKTYVIIDAFQQSSGVTLFQYYDALNNVLTTPISDLTTIKAIRINLAAAQPVNHNAVLTVQVSLRNRKTNL